MLVCGTDARVQDRCDECGIYAMGRVKRNVAGWMGLSGIDASTQDKCEGAGEGQMQWQGMLTGSKPKAA